MEGFNLVVSGGSGQSVPIITQISEIDLNPVKGEDEDLKVVDCRIII